MENTETDDKFDSEEYEEVTMVLELNGVLETDTIRTAIKNGSVAIRKVNTEQPFVQLGNSVYSGHWTQTLGTDLILATSSTDNRQLEYVASTDTRLVCHKALLASLNEDDKAFTPKPLTNLNTKKKEKSAPTESQK